MGRGRVLLSMVLALSFALPAAAFAQVPDDYPYNPNQSPPGANDFSCTPSAAHPEPVVLVHGLGANMAQNWGYISPALAADGYCVFALTYGRMLDNPPPFDQMGGLKRMEDSAQVLSAFVDRVLAETGASKVDIVGHSEGSLMPNYYVKFLGGAAKVDDYVGMTPLWDGTNVAMAGDLSDQGRPSGFTDRMYDYFRDGCESCPDFIRGSDFLANMNSGPTGPRVGGVDYTMIMTKNDELVQPYESGHMDGAANFVLQDICQFDPVEHLGVAFDPLALRIIRNALDPSTAVEPSCSTYFYEYAR